MKSFFVNEKLKQTYSLFLWLQVIFSFKSNRASMISINRFLLTLFLKFIVAVATVVRCINIHAGFKIIYNQQQQLLQNDDFYLNTKKLVS